MDSESDWYIIHVSHSRRKFVCCMLLAIFSTKIMEYDAIASTIIYRGGRKRERGEGGGGGGRQGDGGGGEVARLNCL